MRESCVELIMELPVALECILTMTSFTNSGESQIGTIRAKLRPCDSKTYQPLCSFDIAVLSFIIRKHGKLTKV